jgi:hypothetical protein
MSVATHLQVPRSHNSTVTMPMKKADMTAGQKSALSVAASEMSGYTGKACSLTARCCLLRHVPNTTTCVGVCELHSVTAACTVLLQHAQSSMTMRQLLVSAAAACTIVLVLDHLLSTTCI